MSEFVYFLFYFYFVLCIDYLLLDLGEQGEDTVSRLKSEIEKFSGKAIAILLDSKVPGAFFFVLIFVYFMMLFD